MKRTNDVKSDAAEPMQLNEQDGGGPLDYYAGAQPRLPAAERPIVAAAIVFSPIIIAILLLVLYMVLSSR